MGTAPRQEFGIVVLIAGVALGAAGCLPIAHSSLVSPAIVGTYYRTDGRPANGWFELGVSAIGDSTCTSTTLRTQTDSAGEFHFAKQEIRSNWTLLIPFDAVAPVYSICYRREGIAREVYRGIAARGDARDSVTCLATPPGDTVAVRCNGLRPWRRLVTPR